jgi:hypothetical protein
MLYILTHRSIEPINRGEFMTTTKRELRNEWHLQTRNGGNLIAIYSSSEDAHKAGDAYTLRTGKNCSVLRPWVDAVLSYEKKETV